MNRKRPGAVPPAHCAESTAQARRHCARETRVEPLRGRRRAAVSWPPRWRAVAAGRGGGGRAREARALLAGDRAQRRRAEGVSLQAAARASRSRISIIWKPRFALAFCGRRSVRVRDNPPHGVSCKVLVPVRGVGIHQRPCDARHDRLGASLPWRSAPARDRVHQGKVSVMPADADESSRSTTSFASFGRSADGRLAPKGTVVSTHPDAMLVEIFDRLGRRARLRGCADRAARGHLVAGAASSRVKSRGSRRMRSVRRRPRRVARLATTTSAGSRRSLQAALGDQPLVDRAEPALERRPDRRAERDRLAVHRAAGARSRGRRRRSATARRSRARGRRSRPPRPARRAARACAAARPTCAPARAAARSTAPNSGVLEAVVERDRGRRAHDGERLRAGRGRARRAPPGRARSRRGSTPP